MNIINRGIKRLVLAVAVTVLIAMLGVILFAQFMKNEPYKTATFLDDGWNVEINGEEFKDVTLSSLTFDGPVCNEPVILSRVLKEGNYKDATLRGLFHHSKIKVFLENELIYSYGENYDGKGMVGSGYHWIRLPDDYMNKVVRIEVVPTEQNAFTNFDVMVIDNEENVYLDFISVNILSINVAVFLVIFGFTLLIITIFMLFYNKQFLRLCWIALFSILIGIWTLGNTKVIQLISNNLELNNFFEFTSLYLAPLPITLFFYDVRKNEKDAKTSFIILLFVTALFGVTVCVLQALNIVHYPYFLVVCHAVVLLNLLYIVSTSVRRINQQSLSEQILLVGMLILAVFVVVELVRFNYQKYVDASFAQNSTSYLSLGTLVFVMFLIISYCTYALETLYTKTEKELLIKVAYTDFLTGINNRTKCEELFKELDETDRNYAIISFDLNNLKKVNDELGHIHGDQLIKGFAKMLSICFEGFGEVGRMGGDEFIVILDDVTKDLIETYLDKLQKIMQTENESRSDIQFSTSYGYALKEELVLAKAVLVYNLADKRMYAMKSKLKKRNGRINDRG